MERDTRVITTIDNPYNPFTQEDEWFSFDVKEKKYNTYGRLASLCEGTDENGPVNYQQNITRAQMKLIDLSYMLNSVSTEDGEWFPKYCCVTKSNFEEDLERGKELYKKLRKG